MTFPLHSRSIGQLMALSLAAATGFTPAAFAQEGPLYNCPPGYLWTVSGCVQAPPRPSQGQKAKIPPGPKAHSLAPANPNILRTEPKPLPRAKASTDLRPGSKPSEIPPKWVNPGNPKGSPHGALNPQPIPPGYPPKPSLKSVAGKSR